MRFVIKSNNSDRELVFSNLEGEYFQVELRGSRVRAKSTVYDNHSAKDLNIIFQKLGQLDRP